MRFDDRVIVITGVGRRGQVGEVVARAFAGRGATLGLVERSVERARERAAEIATDGTKVFAFEADLSRPDSTRELATQLSAALGARVDALVHLAGGFESSGTVGESDPETWDRMFAINFFSAVHTTRALLPSLRRARGAIVYFASEAALPGARTAEVGAYAAAKSALVSLVRTIAIEERANGVRANALAPGTIRTAENEASMGASARYIEREAVADAVCWLCSPAARAVSGQVIPLSAAPT